MPTPEIEVLEPWFSLIKSGAKTVECRARNDLLAQIKEGDLLAFTNITRHVSRTGEISERKKRFKVRVTRIINYTMPNSIDKFLKGESLARTLPGIRTYEDGRAHYIKILPDMEYNDLIAFRFIIDSTPSISAAVQ